MTKGLLHALLFLIACTILIISCQSGANKNAARQNEGDSADFRIALLPIEECAPFYFARQAGIYDSLGIKVNLVAYNSQFDCDTAIRNRRVDVSVSDKIRMATYSQKTAAWEPLVSPSGKWGLAVSGQLRIRKAKDISGRMIGMSRKSASYWWLQHFLSKAGVAEDDIFQIQINDIPLRCRMLLNNQIDAAILPEPYLTIAKLNGAKILAVEKSPDDAPSVILITKKQLQESTQQEKIKKLKEAYRISLSRMSSFSKATKDSVLQNYYRIPAEWRDSITF